MSSSLQNKYPNLVVNGYNCTNGGGLRIFQGMVRFLGDLPKDGSTSAPVVLFSPRHDASLIDEARALGLTVIVYQPTRFQQLDQALLYFVNLPIRALFARHSECLVNLGDFIVPFARRQIYYFDWLYAVIEAADVWKQMTWPERINRAIKWANIRLFIKTPKVVIVQSQFVAQQMIKVLGRQSPIVIPCPVEEFEHEATPSVPAMPHSISRTHRFLCLSSFASHKNVDILLKVAAHLKSRGLAAQILLTLDDTDRKVKAFTKRIDESELSQFIVNIGVLKFRDVDAWFAISDALLLPTKLETFGLPYVESLTRGRPILTSDLPFAHEICRTGTMFFDPDDPENIADAIETFIQNGGIDIDEAEVRRIVEDCRPERVFSEILSQTRF